MADAPANTKGAGYLTKKVGPLPVFMWALLAVGAYYWYTHYGPGKTAAAPAATGATAADTLGSNQITTTLYTDDSAWAAAAITYLAGDGGQTSNGIGIPLQQATVEIDNYLRGLPNTAQGQSDVQLAINSVGPPPVAAPTPATPAPAPAPGGGTDSDGDVDKKKPPVKKKGGGGTGPPTRKPRPPVHHRRDRRAVTA